MSAIDEDSGLVKHARRELTRVGEEPYVIDWYLRTITAFVSFGHSGGSAMVAIPVLTELLNFHPLSDLTDDPAEWIDHSEMSGVPMWQSTRRPDAFSTDGGRSYRLLAEQAGDGVTPLHQSAPASAIGETAHRT